MTISPATATSPGDPTLLVSQKTNHVAVRLLTPKFKNEVSALPSFIVAVNNQETAPLALSLSNVTVFSGEHAVRLYTAAELVDRIQHEAEAEAQSAAAEEAVQRQSMSTTRNDATLTPVVLNRSHALATATEGQRSYGKQAAELAKTLNPITINPSETGTGVIKLHPEDIVPGQPLRIVVKLPSETHEFSFNVSR